MTDQDDRGKQVKAAVYYQGGEPDVLLYEELPDPVCGPEEVLIDVHAVSIEGGDVLARTRNPASTPFVGGYLASGIIVEVGTEVADRFVGQRVATMGFGGSHASMRAVDAVTAWPIPDNLDLEAAACIPIPFGTADDSLFAFGRLVAGESVLIHAGASGTGLAGIQLAKRAGATVLATASSDDRLERLKAYGLDHGINYAQVDFVEAARDLTGGRGPDLIVDSVGGKNLEKSLQCAAYRGRIIAMGGAGRDSYRPNFALMGGQNKTYVSYYQGAELQYNSARAQANVQRLIGEIAEGQLQVVIDRRYRLSEAAQAHAYIESRKAFGRVILIPDELM